MDEKKGPLAANLLNKKHTAKQYGGEWTKGRIGNAFHVKDGNAYLKATDGKMGSYKGDKPFSISTWVKTTGKVDGSIISKMDVSSRVTGYELRAKKRKFIAVFCRTILDIKMEVITENDVFTPNQWHHVTMTYDGSKRAMGVSLYVDGKPQVVKVISDMLGSYNFSTGSPITIGCRGIRKEKPIYSLTGGAIDDVRIYNRRLENSEIVAIAYSKLVDPILKRSEKERTVIEKNILQAFYTSQFDSNYQTLEKEWTALRTKELALLKKMPTTLIYRERKNPRVAHFLNRGEYDKPGPKVERGTPSVLPPMPKGAAMNRLGLAKWLTQKSHPLTARVTVNRLWQQAFGTGLVKTSEDFGSQGEPPSHPKLLDWLAVDFQENNWDVKRLMKQMVMSATYRQNSNVTPEIIKRDPENRLYARGPRYRLDAEMLRDQALAVSGLLVNQLGGPSVKPPQPEGLWFAVAFTTSNTAKFKKDVGANKIYRRSLYTFYKRTSPPPSMTTFDAPSREACVVRRERTNTPLQALLLMNDPQYVEAARFFAQRMMAEGGKTPEEQIAWSFKTATSRPISKRNQEVLLKAFHTFHTAFKKDPESAKKLIEVGETANGEDVNAVELATRTMLANILFNLDEFVTKE